MEKGLVLSTLPKTWILDLDGTLVKHNGYKFEGEDSLLLNAKEYLDALPAEDKVIILTSRKEEYREQTLKFLEEHSVRFDEILFNMPMGERIVINDKKPSGIPMAVAINLERDCFMLPDIHRER